MRNFVLRAGMAGVRLLAAVLLAPLLVGAADTPSGSDYAADARSIERLVNDNYAYLDRFEGGRMPMSDKFRAEAEAVDSREALIRYAERALAALADHHAITGSSFNDSWAIIPTYADLWVVRRGGQYLIEAVREGSPAEKVGIAAGDNLIAVGEVPTQQAVETFWKAMGLQVTPERADYAARVLAAGRRDRPRDLTVSHGGASRRLSLPNLYTDQPDRPLLTVTGRVIRFNNSLGDQGTIEAFDKAMAALPRNAPVVLDFSDTPSGGNTSVARAIMGWFVDRPRNYQVHNLPAEERETGIPRQWVEQVLPRAGKTGNWVRGFGRSRRRNSDGAAEGRGLRLCVAVERVDCKAAGRTALFG
jgi:carboxyl-terminal processing protease